MKIFVDSRERKKKKSIHVAEELERLGAEIERTPLAPADIACSGYDSKGELHQVGIELKTFTDFLASVKPQKYNEPRIWQQSFRLRDAYPAHHILVVSGNRWQALSRERKPQWAEAQLDGAIASLLYNGFPMWNAIDDHVAAKLIYKICEKIEKPAGKRPLPYVPKNVPIHEEKENLLGAMRGVGLAKAQALLTVYGSIRNISLSNVNELALVPVGKRKLGEAAAKHILEVLN